MKIEPKDLQFIYSQTIICGTEVLYVLHPIAPMPIAHCYFRQIMVKHLDILDIYVYNIFHRQGIGSKMIESLCCEYPGFSIVTESANDMSRGFLQKNKFVQTPRGWELPFPPIITKKK